MSGVRTKLRWRRAVTVSALCLLAGCSAPEADRRPASGHAYELALAWAAGASTDGFHFAIACPGPQKLVLFRTFKVELSCNVKGHIDATSTEASADEPTAGAAGPKLPALDCYLVVVPAFKDVGGVLADMRRGIAAGRAGPVDCALIRYR